MEYNVVSAKYMFSIEDTYKSYKKAFDLVSFKITKDKYYNENLVINIKDLNDLISFVTELNCRILFPNAPESDGTFTIWIKDYYME